MPDPDLPPVELSDSFIKEVSKQMPTMPNKAREFLAKVDIDQTTIETLLDEIIACRLVLAVIDSGIKHNLIAKKIANWLVGDVQALVAANKLDWSELKLNVNNFVALAELVEQNKVSSSGAKAILVEMVKTGDSPSELAEKLNVLQVSDEGKIEKIVQDIIKANPQAAEDVKSGELKAIGFLVGQVMKVSKGSANPGMAQILIKKKLGL